VIWLFLYTVFEYDLHIGDNVDFFSVAPLGLSGANLIEGLSNDGDEEV